LGLDESGGAIKLLASHDQGKALEAGLAGKVA
jgi:hypothetical protein